MAVLRNQRKNTFAIAIAIGQHLLDNPECVKNYKKDNFSVLVRGPIVDIELQIQIRKIYNLKYSLNKEINLNYPVSSKNPVDHIQGLKELVNSGDKFVRAYSNLAGDLPGFILYQDEQILDMFSLIMAGNDGAGFVIHVNKTFDIGIYHVTCLSYKNLKLITKEYPKGNPLFMGPIFVHKNKNFDFF